MFGSALPSQQVVFTRKSPGQKDKTVRGRQRRGLVARRPVPQAALLLTGPAASIALRQARLRQVCSTTVVASQVAHKPSTLEKVEPGSSEEESEELAKASTLPWHRLELLESVVNGWTCWSEQRNAHDRDEAQWCVRCPSLPAWPCPPTAPPPFGT